MREIQFQPGQKVFIDTSSPDGKMRIKKAGLFLGMASSPRGSADTLVLCDREIIYQQHWLIHGLEAAKDVPQTRADAARRLLCVVESKRAEKNGGGLAQLIQAERELPKVIWQRNVAGPMIQGLNSLHPFVREAVKPIPDVEASSLFDGYRELQSVPSIWLRGLPNYPSYDALFQYPSGDGKELIAQSRQVLTEDFIASVVAHLRNSVNDIHKKTNETVRILDLACGVDPRFALFVCAGLDDSKCTEYSFVGIDTCIGDGLRKALIEAKVAHARAFKIQEALQSYNGQLLSNFNAKRDKPVQLSVFCADAQNSIAELQPHIVICSWMPRDIDFTPNIRAVESVQEYILVGPEQICGTAASWNVHPGFTKEKMDMPTPALKWNVYGLNGRVSSAFSYRK